MKGLPLKVLVVGAGAVGQVYGHAFARGGSEVSFLVKPRHVEELKQGLRLFHLNARKDMLFHDYETLSDLEAVKSRKWDFVVLTVPSDAFYTPWLGELASALNKEAVVVTLQPNLKEREELLKWFPQEKIVLGVIALIAYPTPLGTKWPQEKGMAYWLPPMGKVPFDGNENEVARVVMALRKGGLPAASKKFSESAVGVPHAAAVLNLFVNVLEKEQWRLAAFKDKAVSRRLTGSINEAFAVLSRSHGLPLPFFRHFMGRAFYNLLIRLSLWMMPFDLETYLKFHFTKVGPQMRLNLEHMLNEAKKINMPVPHLEGLR